MRWLGLDVGTRTIGVAVCDEDEVVATPLLTLVRQGGLHDLEAVATVAREQRAAGLVLGLPLELEGREGDAALRVRRLGGALGKHMGCQVKYWDERFSTVIAERALLESDMRRRRRKQVIDKVAAAVILQGYIDRQGAAQ